MAVPLIISQLSNALGATTTGLGTMTSTMRAATAAGTTSSERIVNSQATLAQGIGGLVGMMATTFNALLNEFNDYTRQSSKFGDSFAGVMSEQNASVAQLNDSIANKFTIALALNNEGVFGNNKQLANLASIQNAAGQDFKATISTLKNNALATGLGTDSMNRLAEESVRLSTTYRVSSEQMVAAVQQLQQSNENLSLISGSDSEAITMAVQGLAAQSGGGTETVKAMTSFANLLTSTDPTKQAQVASLGLADLQQRLIQATDPTEIQSILKEANQRAIGVIDTLKGPFVAAGGAVQQAFGRDTIVNIQRFDNSLAMAAENARQQSELQKKLAEATNPEERKRIEAEMAKAVDPRQTIDNLLGRVFDPLKEVFFKFIPIIIESVVPAVEFFSNVLMQVADFVSPIINIFVELTTAVFSFVTNIFKFVDDFIGIKNILVALAPAIIVGLAPLFITLMGATLSLLLAFGSLAIAILTPLAPFILIAGVIYGVYKLFEEELKPTLDGIIISFNSLKENFAGVFSSIAVFIRALGSFNVDAIIDSIQSVFFRILGVLFDAVMFVPKLMANLGNAIMEALPDWMVPDALKEFGNAVPKFLDDVSTGIKDSASQNLASAKEALQLQEDKTKEANSLLGEIAGNTKPPPSTLPDYFTDLNKELESAFSELLGLNGQTMIVNELQQLNENMNSVDKNIETQNSMVGEGNDISRQMANNAKPKLSGVGDGGG
jgi:hypothetical protein